MNYDALEAAINEKTKAIIPVDLGDVPFDYNKIFEIVERKKQLFSPNNDIQAKIGRIAVVADAAHAFGAKWHGEIVGNIADFFNFSLVGGKNFTGSKYKNQIGFDLE